MQELTTSHIFVQISAAADLQDKVPSSVVDAEKIQASQIYVSRKAETQEPLKSKFNEK